MRKRVLTSMIFLLLLCGMFLFTLSACGGDAVQSPPVQSPGGALQSPAQGSDPIVITPPASDDPQPSDPQPSAPSVEPPAVQSPDPAQVPTGQPAAPTAMTMMEAYRAALEGIYTNHLYPNGDEVPVPEWADMANNDFAVFDVDGDGIDELLYQNDDSTMAGMSTHVFRFDEEFARLDVELWGFVAMTFYDNGIVTEMASHNQGMGQMEDFWPYTLFQYDPGSDGYLVAGQVDGWDGTFFPNDHDGNPFPADIDADGDKAVYILTYPGPEVTETTVDGPEYQAWLDSYLAGASELTIPWQSMTPENIRAVAP